MKIGIDIRAIGQQRTGDEVYTLNLVKNLLKIDNENQYFFYANTENVKELEKIKSKIDPRNKSKNYKIIPILPAGKMFWTFWSLPKYLSKNPIDVLLVQYITPLFLPRGIKLVTVIHDVSFKTLPWFISKKDLFFLKTLIPLSLSRADRIIAVSDFTKSEIEKYYDVKSDKIKKVFNGVANDSFSKEVSLEVADKMKRKFNLANPFIFYVGTFQPRKNIPFLLEAFEQLKIENQNNEKIKNLDLVLAGNRQGHNFDVQIDVVLDEIKKRSPNVSEYIKFIGFVEDDDLPMLYKMAETVVFPSLYEGFGLPLIEAMVAGKPVIYSDSSCFEEVSDGAGLTFQQGDKTDFTKKIFDTIINEDLRNNLIVKGRQRARFFSWEKCADETLQVFKELTN